MRTLEEEKMKKILSLIQKEKLLQKKNSRNVLGTWFSPTITGTLINLLSPFVNFDLLWNSIRAGLLSTKLPPKILLIYVLMTKLLLSVHFQGV